MDTFIIRPDDKNKIKGLAYYQIAGGIFGICLVIYLIALTTTISGLILLLFSVFIGLYSFSIFCGQQLLAGQINRGLKLSTINQFLQTINFAMFGFAYKFIAGLMLSVDIDYTTSFKFIFNFSFPTVEFSISNDSELRTVGINLFAIYVIYFIDKLKKKIALDKELFEASQQAAVDSTATTT